MKTIRLLKAVIGIDLGNARHTICVLDASGEVFEERTIPNTRPSLTKLANQYPKAVVAMEVGTHSPWVSRWLKGEGCEVIVANPRKLRMIYENERKSDERDAQMLARLAKFDRTLLHPVEHVSEQEGSRPGLVPAFRAGWRAGEIKGFQEDSRPVGWLASAR